MWMSDVHNLGNYTFAAGLLVLGMNVWQVFTALLVGFVLDLRRHELDGQDRPAHGVPFPVVSRISFGVWGANIPALIRAVIAIMWYGIQTYLASVAVNVMLLAAWPGLESWTHGSFLGARRARLDSFCPVADPGADHQPGMEIGAQVPGLLRPGDLAGDDRAGGVGPGQGRLDISLNLAPRTRSPWASSGGSGSARSG